MHDTIDSASVVEASRLLQIAAVIFGIAAVAGITMAGMRFSGLPRPPNWLAMGHGLLASAGLSLLIYAACTTAVPLRVQLAAVFFVLAAIGGATINLMFHSKLLPLPIPLMLGHALLAVVGYVLLLLALYG